MRRRAEKGKYQPAERDGRRVFFPGCSREYNGINLLEDTGSHVYYSLWLAETRVVRDKVEDLAESSEPGEPFAFLSQTSGSHYRGFFQTRKKPFLLRLK